MNRPATIHHLHRLPLFTEEIHAFTTYLLAKNHSQSTIDAYTRDVRQLAQWLAETTIVVDSPAKVTKQDIVEFLAYLATLQLSGVTRARKLAAIREFFKFLQDSGNVASSPAATVSVPRREQRNRVYLTPEEYNRLLAAAGGNPRDFAILMLFLQTGIRVSELVHLTLDDVDLAERVLRIEDSKGRKSREIPLEKKATQALKHYLAVRPPSYDQHLFLSYQGEGISLRGVKKLVTKYKERAGIHKKISCHSLRHTFASAKAEHGVSAYHLQQFLGHSSLAVTQRYVHLTKTTV